MFGIGSTPSQNFELFSNVQKWIHFQNVHVSQYIRIAESYLFA